LTQQQPPASPDKPDQPTEQASQPEPAQASEPEPELPDQPAAAPPPPPPVPATPAPKKKRRVWLIVTLSVVAVLILLVVGGVFLVMNVLREEVPQVGECLNEASPEDMEVVDCGSAEAAWNVVGSDGTWTRGDFDAAAQGDVCQEFPETQQALWVTESPTVDSGTEGEVICLAPIG
jgi:hypothetical protein